MALTKCPKCGFSNPADQSACSRCRTALPRVSIQDDAGGVAVAQGDSSVSFRRGQIIANRYTVIDLIGRGGMGCIYRVHDNTLDEEVALKTLLPQFVRDKIVVERFYNEARIARQLSHINIVRVHDIGFAGNVLYISMEYLRGRSLRGLMDDLPPGERLPIRTTLKIMDELCASLEYAHRFTVHRDIKPENVMIGVDGSVKLMDFGISKLMTHNQLTAVSMVMGTPYYMSPEQLKDSSSVDARADIYSVGVMLYEMLTGNLPTGLVKPASQTISGVPATLDPIVARCCEPDPRNRFASAHELREALRPIRELVEPGSSSSAPVAVRPTGRSGALRAVGALLAVLILAGAGYAISRLEERRATLLASSESAPAVPATPSRQDDAAEYRGLSEFIEGARERATAAAGENDADKQIVALGDRFWTAAEDLRGKKDPDALSMAWRAAQCYAGVLGVPEGMVFVPPGKVTYAGGAQVWVDGFFMDRAEVTNSEFAEFCRQAKWQMPPYSTAVDSNGQSIESILSPGDVPVTLLTFFDAQAYAAAANKSLPTYAQWQRATVQLDGTYHAFPWGDSPQADAANVAGSVGNSGTIGPEPPGSFEADTTAFGCRDMAGNVREWTRSLVPATPGTPPAEVQPDDDAKALLGQHLLVCGGSYGLDASPLYAVADVPARQRDWSLGFRCAREIPRRLDVLQNLGRNAR